MEQKIEKVIDKALDSTFGSISSQIRLFNIGGGIILIILGIILMAQKSSSIKKVKKNMGLFCVGIGMLVIISNFILTI